MITPTVGRIVWFHPAPSQSQIMRYDDRPCAATIAYVWNDRMVNLSVTDHAGTTHPVTSVTLVQDGDQPHAGGWWCEWMPFQKGQAAKTEQLEKQIAQPAGS